MDWTVEVNPGALALLGVVWQWARGQHSIHNGMSAAGVAVLTAVAYVATVRPELPPSGFQGYADLAYHFATWTVVAYGFARVAKDMKVAPATAYPKGDA